MKALLKPEWTDFTPPQKETMMMKNGCRKALAAFALVLALSLSAFAGVMHTGITDPPPPPDAASPGEMHTGEMQTGVMQTGLTATDTLTVIALDLLRNLLAA
jgi:hypothetical protein